ncbi:CPX chromosomal region candidate gene 1 protein [Orycteropus afer afer]|uniref:CPX chromosomal region candidate gene 1 protein n=1 Tax=Orycteropus afer afer TaxID=1230840 RepID=A0AC54ZEZ0_ORYAF|nr:CPX chromosomal region candidate gene 1 protein [Orycteropus afer afer]
MTPPGEEESDPSDNAVSNSEESVPNDSNTDTEPSFADCSGVYQVETDQIDGQPNTPVSQEAGDPQATENNEYEVQKTKKDSQEEDSKEDPLPILIPIPRKLFSHNPLTNRSKFYSGKVEMKTSGFSHTTVKQNIHLQLSDSWRIPFINNQDLRKMILRLLLGRNIPQKGGHKSAMQKKQKYTPFLPPQYSLPCVERSLIFGRPMRVYYHLPLSERMASQKFCKPSYTKQKTEFKIFVRPMFYVPQVQRRNTFIRKTLEDSLRPPQNIPIVIIGTNNDWKYRCPICGNSFNTLVEFRQHSCRFP